MAAAPPQVLSAAFVGEVRAPEGMGTLPPARGPVVAIAGRSNVGKSTLLNALAARQGLARTSKTPGRTRGLIFYDLTMRFAEAGGARTLDARFADLPGYGFARVGRSERESWGPLVEGFVAGPPRPVLFLALVDARRGIEADDQELSEWLTSERLAHRFVATKIDKLNAGQRGLIGQQLRAALGASAPPVLPVSAHTGDGLARLWHVIGSALAAAPDGAPPEASGDQ